MTEPQSSAVPHSPAAEDASYATLCFADLEMDGAVVDQQGTQLGQNNDTSVAADGWSAPISLPPREDCVGRTIGRYRLVGLLGEGGMGLVYRGRDDVVERDVAVKLLPPELALQDAACQRFLSEAKAAGRLSHPHTVNLYEAGVQEGVHYLVMELVSGGSLAEEVRRIGPLAPAAATRATLQAARGLAAAHAVGMVHRDIKPANLLRTDGGSVKVCDFGLAKGHLADQNMTRAGQVVGTPRYMSPEQCSAGPVDERSDVYSLGATYYYLLTGRDPYADVTGAVAVMFAHCHGDPLDPCEANPQVPAACAAVVRTATAKAPCDRYQSMAEMSAALERVGAEFSVPQSLQHRNPSGRSSPNFNTVAPRFRQRGRIAAVLATLFTATLLLAAGGLYHFAGGSPSETALTEAAANAATLLPAVAALPPIPVGVLHSLSGTMADSESPVVDAVLLAIEEINREGGIDGRPLRPIVADGKSDSRVFLQEATRLLDEEQVAVVFGCWTSASRKTVVPLFEDRGALLVYPVQYEGLEMSPNVFYTGPAPNQQLLPALRWARENLGVRRVFLVGSDYVFPRTAAAIVRDAAAELDVEVVGEAYVTLGSGQVAHAVAEIVAAQPDLILNTIDGADNTPFFAALRRAGFTPDTTPTLSLSVSEEELRHLDAAAMAGDYAAANYFQSADWPANAGFVQAFQNRYGSQRVLTDAMAAAYTGVKMWAAAARDADSVATHSVLRSLRTGRFTSPEGEVRVEAASQHLHKTPHIGRVRANGQFELIWSAADPISPQPYPPTRSAADWHAFLRELQHKWRGAWSQSD